jgi:putative heme-binding domain-containing protein
VVSDQYRASVIETIKGKIITGRVTSDANGKVIVLTDPEDGTKVVEIPKADVESITPSKVSLMPKDLLKTLNQDELLDLLAYLMSRGNPNDVMFAK